MSAAPDLSAQRRPAVTAANVMTGDVATVSGRATLGEAMTLMRNLGVRHLPVITDGRFAGLVDDRLVAFALLAAGDGAPALGNPVTSAMTHYVPQVGPGDDLHHVAHLLRTSRSDAVVVIDGQDHLLGIITVVDVLATVALSPG